MVSKNNHRLVEQRNGERIKQRWALRKYSIGVASVLLGTTIFFGSSAVAHADTTGEATATTETEQVTKQDGQQNNQQVVVLSNNAQSDHPSTTQPTAGAANVQSANEQQVNKAQLNDSAALAKSAQHSEVQSASLIHVNDDEDQDQPAISERSEDKQITYNFVDVENNNANVGEPIKVTNKNDRIVLPYKYTLADGETLPTEYDFNSDNGKTFNIRLKHLTEQVSRKKQITRTINYVDENGHKLANSVTQTSKTLIQYGSKDVVTGDITWDDWNFVDSDSTSHLPIFDSFEIPRKPGYHPVITDNNYQSAINGQSVKTIPRSGITVDKNGNPVSTTIDVYYQSDEEPYLETKTVTRDIYIQAGSKPIKVATQYVTLHRINTKNILTGEIRLGLWDTATFPPVNAPELNGYTVQNPYDAVSIPVGDTRYLSESDEHHTATFLYSKNNYSDNTEVVNQPKTVTRDIYTQIEGQSTRQKVATQEVTIYRVGVKNLSTGEVTWTDWLTSNIPEYAAPTMTGYTVTNPDAGATVTVDGSETQLPDVVFEYQANTATNQSSNASMNSMQENDDTVDPNKKSITRTIIIHKLDGTTNKIVQTINFEKFSESDSFAAVDSPEIAGYTTNTKQVPEEEATFDANDQGRPYSVTRVTKPVNVVYTANEQSINVIYKYGKQIIKTTPLNGHTGETVDVDLDVPANYYVTNDVPTSYKFKANGNEDIIVELEHDIEPDFDTKTIKRIINVTNPDGNSKTVIQEVTLNGQVWKDLVTGDIISWQDWSTGAWNAYTVPTIPGYTPNQASVERQIVTFETADTTVNITYKANEQSINIIYKDGNQTIKSEPLSGHTDETVNVDLDVPVNYHATNNVPTSYKFKATDNNDIIVKLAHNTEQATDTKTITRTINVTSPNGNTKTTKQTATISREGTKDLVTGDTNWQEWSTGAWNAYTVPTIPGYTPSQASVERQTVTVETADTTVNITYTANEQSINIIYKDGNQTIKSEPLSGHTDETVNVVLDVPANYHVTNANNVPKNYTFKATDNHDIIVELAHNTQSTSETKDITRTINVTNPDGTTMTIKQPVTISRDGTKDLVTGDTTWQDWSTGTWDAYTVPTIAGYTPTQTSVASQTVTSETEDATVDISYVANEQHANIIYKDGDQVIKTTPITGTTGQTINIQLEVPEHYHVTNEVPATYTFQAETNNDVIVELGHDTQDANDSKSVVRTIKITNPDNQTKTIEQTATISRQGTKDLVTNETDWQDWTRDTWDTYIVPTIVGYTPSQSVVASQTVDSNTQPVTIEITYAPDTQHVKVIYQTPDGTPVQTDTLTGNTDEVVAVPGVPAHYHALDPVPENVKMRPGMSDIIINVVPNTTPVNDSKSVVRTINITDPDGTTRTIKQTADLTRTGTQNDVTREITWNGWSESHWDAFDTPVIPGYTANIAHVPYLVVDGNSEPVTVDISYTANDQLIHVIYKDGDQVIKTDPLTGKTGQTVHVVPEVPAGYHLVSQSATDYTFKATDNQDIIIQVAKDQINPPTDNHDKQQPETPTPETPTNDHQQQPAELTTDAPATNNVAQEKLPQTGNEENEHVLLGALLGSLGLSMIGGTLFRKKRQKED